jgi:cyclic beta-1,2-glucan synthetase
VSSLRERLTLAVRLKSVTTAREHVGDGLVEPPLAVELFSVSQLEEHARTLAGWHKLEPPQRRAPDRLLSRLGVNATALREAHAFITETVKAGTRITPAAEWFIDNYYIVEEQIRTARRHLPRGYNRELPRLANGQHAGTPRVYDLVLELVSHSHGRIDLDSLRAFVTSYQSVSALRLGELWAIPIMLRLALIENLGRVVSAVTAGRRDRDSAGRWAERMLEAAATAPAKVVLVLAEMIKEGPPLTSAFVTELSSRVQGKGATLMFPIAWLEQRLSEQGQTVEHLFEVVRQGQAEHQVAIGNIIGSLRTLGATDWRTFVEATSVVERTLRDDPAGVYAAMDFATRDQYRRVVEQISKRSAVSEEDVARAALRLCDASSLGAGVGVSAAAGDVGGAGDEDSFARRRAHVGYFLVDEGRGRLERDVSARRSLRDRAAALGYGARLACHLGAVAIVTGAVTVMLTRAAPVVSFAGAAFVVGFAVLAICASQLAIGVVHWAEMLLVRPRLLPRLDFSKGIPAAHLTVVAVPTLLTEADEIDDLLQSLEVRFLANRDNHLAFALVSDFRDAARERMDEDGALLQRAVAGIEALNTKYVAAAPPESSEAFDGRAPFFLFHRARRLNAREGVWMGWERKRGKIEELNAALRGEVGHFETTVGDVGRLQGAKFVIVLDSDTQLPRDSARVLVGTLAHWLNRPCYDHARGRVTRGYSILQPRVAVTMASSSRSLFARLFAGDPGIDPYTRAVSDVYQDLFDEGSFIGKGIYDIDSFGRALGSRLPDNRILSHDLLESAYGRSALVSDVTLFEDHPSTYAADLSRRYRWMRGDWQITPWLGRRVPSADGRRTRNPISLLARWKIFDNLRRGLVPLALLVLLVASAWAPGAARFGALAAVAIIVLPGLLAAAAELSRRPTDLPWARHLDEIGDTLGRQLLREVFALACLPYEACVSAHAIGRTAFRVLVTRRRLLEWRTASDAQRGARKNLAGTYLEMWFSAACVLAAASGLALRNRAALDAGPSAAVLALWLLGPGLVWMMSRPQSPVRPRLTADDRRFLRLLARRTWRFFEVFVGPADNHLPPDNFQEDPPRGIAHRTSPTNIGLALTANLAAYDFGYLTAFEVIERTTSTLAAMDKLPRFRGHFYNWYDTESLEPLRPMYVSTVDSGNLAGHLLTLAGGLNELGEHETFRFEIFTGLLDTVDLMDELASAGARSPEAAAAVSAALQGLQHSLLTPPRTLAACRLSLERLVLGGQALSVSLAAGAADAELNAWAGAFDRQCRGALDDLSRIAPWAALSPAPPLPDELGQLVAQLDRPMTLSVTARLASTLADALEHARCGSWAGVPVSAAATAWLAELGAAVSLASSRAAGRLLELRQLAIRCGELGELDYGFLYDRERQLLAIGYNVSDHRLDSSFYDLLASEARLASFVAISQGRLPQEHWFSLGRLLTATGGGTALLSWSGSMFEYLMPLLIMPTYDRTILDDTYRAVVERQIQYGAERDVPWGVSESGYNKIDGQLNYQYRAFGVPGLGLKRGLFEDLVIAPYACAMALMVDPASACSNLRVLARGGQLGAFGFYEAVDYTQSRLPRGKSSVTVRSFMSHHQGMAFLSLDFLLLERPMQRRFEANPAFQATALLLHEKVPRARTITPHPAELSMAGPPQADVENNVRVFNTPDTASPEVHLLSNGRYHVALTNAGGGYSRWRDLAITRWREDATRDNWGSFCYVRDVESRAFWSVTHQPALKPAANTEIVYSLGRAEFRRRDGDIHSYTEISVSPEDDVELRRVSVTNRGRSQRTIELTSFAEVVLAPPAADAAHPAFSNLFVQTELVRARQAILCTRRPRSPDERPPWLIHLMMVQGTAAGPTSYETARGDFVGRGRSLADPAAMHHATLGDSAGAVLDPVVAIRNTVVLEPDETARIHIVTGVAESRDGALALIEKYSDRQSGDRVFELSWTHSQVALQQLGVTEADAQLYERLAGNILYATPTLRAPRSVISRNRSGQSALWAYGISGDLPIVLLRIADRANIGLVRQLVKAHTYWRQKGLVADLVIWNEDASGYRQALQEEILAVIGPPSEASFVDRPGGVFVRRADQLSEEDKILMQTVARAIINDSDGGLADQMTGRAYAELPAVLFPGKDRGSQSRLPAASIPAVDGRVPRDLVAWNGLGGFSPDGREYVIVTTRERRTPAPWVNVLANPWFGTVVSESGGAYTWCENAHSYRLTPWHNDPVEDKSGEALYIRDEDDGRFWSPTPLPAGGALPYVVRHGFGVTTFEYDDGGISTELRTFVAKDAPIKFLVLKIRNRSARPRRLSMTAFFELALGATRAANLPYVVTEIDPASGALLARNPYNSEFTARVAFLDCSAGFRSVSGDRLEFIGRNGTMAAPASMTRTRLSGRVGAGLDPCLAMQVPIELAVDQEREIVFSFGSGRDAADARALVQRFRGTGPARTALAEVGAYWKATLGAVTVETPDPSLNFLTNGWLLYQVLSARLWGRSGFYQSGGAFGFRDQLQDAMALVHSEPALLRKQILLSAARQFREGDVQHWWHPTAGRGVRTRISDDYLWLPVAVCRYVAALHDTGVLQESVTFLEGRLVKPEEDSYYDLPAISEESATIYEHCVRAIKHGLRFGAHGLPLMGSGDWNDGMNLVGDRGQGESVWLAFFLYDVLSRFVDVARLRKDHVFAELCVAEAERLRQNIEEHGWDGAWYRRAYFDDGEPLGSATNPECQIDSLPQSWAVLSRAGDAERSRRGLVALDERLVRPKLGLIQLLDPPFDTSDMKPGYVKGYVPGVRENGGQYTHAAVWAVMAFAAAGRGERAWELFDLINPVRHGDDAEAIATYQVEPYVVSADVYTNPQHAGRGGWTWYTGSAGWMYRLITESLLGLRLEADRLWITPVVRAKWDAFTIHYRYRETLYHITVRQTGAAGDVGAPTLSCDGVAQPDGALSLRNDGKEHVVEVEVRRP